MIAALMVFSATACRPDATADSAAPATIAPPAPTAAAQDGPYAVGARTIRFTDPRGKELVVEVWFPAVVEDGASPDPYPPTTLARAAVRDPSADLRGAPYPVIGFSHGFAGIRFQSVYLTEHLASHGFVVIAPDHARNTFLDLDESAVVDVLIERPGDVAEAVDEVFRQATGDGWAAGLVEDGPWIAAGHSFGSYTSLVLGGGQVDYTGVEAFCEQSWNLACSFAATRDADEVQARVDGTRTVDPRVTGVVPMSPCLWYAFGANGEGLAHAAPALMLAGDRDQVLEYREDARPTFDHHAGPAMLATFSRAGHYAFSDICAIAPIFTTECEEEAAGWVSIEAAQAASATLVTAWVREHLDQGIDGDAALLEQAAWSADGLVEIEAK